MTHSTASLPFLDGHRFVTDGGLETTLIFLEGIDLPHFAAFTLLDDATGQRALLDYFTGYAQMARRRGVGIVLDTPTWRASSDWGELLGYDQAALADVNARAIALLLDVRARHATPESPIVVSGAIGPRGDGYSVDTMMTADESSAYHRHQVDHLARAGADVVTALTMTYPAEAIGIVRAASDVGVPSAISFTVETDGRLPNGESLGDAVSEVDIATGGSAAYFMINCAHPTHFTDNLSLDEPWMQRIRGVRANASTASHAELDEAETLDSGDPVALGQLLSNLQAEFGQVTLLGGCCGTDERHIEQLARSIAS